MKITIVTPSFNQVAFIEETILSVVNQKYAELEYIVFDGGSTDGSVDIIRKHEEAISFWASEPDRGQAHALNRGLMLAKGEIVAYLNSDDVYLPGALERVAEYFAANPSVRWLTGSCIFFGESQSTQKFCPRFDDKLYNWFDHCLIAQPSTFWRRSLLEEYGFFNESYRNCFDYDFWIRLATRGVQCHIIDHPLAAFRLHPTSKTTKEGRLFAMEDAVLQESNIRSLPPHQVHRARQVQARKRARDGCFSARQKIRAGQTVEGLKTLGRIALKCPTIALERAFLGVAKDLFWKRFK